MIRQYIIWRNNHAYNERLCRSIRELPSPSPSPRWPEQDELRRSTVQRPIINTIKIFGRRALSKVQC